MLNKSDEIYKSKVNLFTHSKNLILSPIKNLVDSFLSFSFDPNPTKRLNFWGLIFGNGLSVASVYGHRQESYQRYAAMPTMSKAKMCVFKTQVHVNVVVKEYLFYHYQFVIVSAWNFIITLVFRVIMLTTPGGFILGTLACMVGWAIFAYYTDIGCDPLKAGYISNPNQVLGLSSKFFSTQYSIINTVDLITRAHTLGNCHHRWLNFKVSFSWCHTLLWQCSMYQAYQDCSCLVSLLVPWGMLSRAWVIPDKV